MSEPVKVFFSYSHRDEILRDELDKHLSVLKRLDKIEAWYDRQIIAGNDFSDEIHEQLAAADVILLLISSDFMGSNFCYDIEMKKALERHQQGTARVIPIIMRPVDGWHEMPLGRLATLPTDGKAVTIWGNQDEAFVDVAKGIRRAIDDIYVHKRDESLSSLHSPPCPPSLGGSEKILQSPPELGDLGGECNELSASQIQVQNSDTSEVDEFELSLLQKRYNRFAKQIEVLEDQIGTIRDADEILILEEKREQKFEKLRQIQQDIRRLKSNN